MSQNQSERQAINLRSRGAAPPKQRGRRWLPWLGALLLLGLLVAGFWPRPVPVETVRVTRGLLRSTVEEEGRTRVRQRYLVSAPISGYLRRIPHKVGTVMVGGETVVGVIDPLPSAPLDLRARSLAEERRQAAVTSLERAQATLDYATTDLRRLEALARERMVADQELDVARLRETTVLKEKQLAESQLRLVGAELAAYPPLGLAVAGTNLPPVEVRAPVSGRVLRLLEESERVVTLGTPLVEIGDPADLEVIVEVLSRDGAVIQPGLLVFFDQWGGVEPLTGRVRQVEPAAFTKISALGVEEQRVYVVVDLTTPVAQRVGLGDNFRVEARIITWETADTLKVPVGALFRQGTNWAAYTVSGGRARLQPVKAGRLCRTEIQVLEGLQPGDEVILYPGDRVRAGMTVKPVSL
jgi:HlyD family secretion protein